MGRAEASVASQFSRAVLTIAHRLPNAKVIDFASFVTIYGGVWISKDNSGARVT